MYIKYLHLTRLESLLYNRSGATQEHEQNESTHRLFSWTVNSDDIDKRLGWGLLCVRFANFSCIHKHRFAENMKSGKRWHTLLYINLCNNTERNVHWHRLVLLLTFIYICRASENLAPWHWNALEDETWFQFVRLIREVYLWRVNSGVYVRIHFLHLSIQVFWILTLTVDCKEPEKWITCK